MLLRRDYFRIRGQRPAAASCRWLYPLSFVRKPHMAVLTVARLGNPVLRRAAHRVPQEDITLPAVQGFIDDLISTMREYDGAGLAAPQVHVSQQILAFAVDQNPRYPDAPFVPLTVLINPRITPLGEAMEEDWEGCLSVPDLRGRVARYTHIAVEAHSRAGGPLRFEATGFHARVIQHEYDHLSGKVFVDRMCCMDSLTFFPEFVRYHGAGGAVDATE